MFLAILILLLLSVAIGMGGYIIVKMKEDEDGDGGGDGDGDGDGDDSTPLEEEAEGETVPIKRGSQATKKAKKMEPKPAPVPKKKPDPIDCVGSWSPWTDCTAKCNQDDGVRQRVFTVQRKAEHGGSPCSAGDKEKEMDACKASKGHYRNTGGCSKSCGSGEQRQDFVLTTRGHDQGSSCPPATKFVKCNTHPCPVNCVGAWHSERPRCSIGRGSRKKYQYRISRNARHGGAGCPHRHGEIKHTGRCRTH